MKSECAEGGPDAKYAAQKGLALTERAAVSVSLLRGDSARAPGERTFLKLASTTRKEDAGAGDPHLPSYRVEQPAWEFNLQSDGPEDSQRMQRDLLISPHRPARSALSGVALGRSRSNASIRLIGKCWQRTACISCPGNVDDAKAYRRFSTSDAACRQ